MSAPFKASLEQLAPTFDRALEAGQTVTFTITGHSMRPLFKHARTAVCIERRTALKAGDICLYRRTDGQYVLHRLMEFQADGLLTMRGDAQFVLEPDLHPEQVIGVVAGYYRGKRYIPTTAIRYRLYTRVWLRGNFIRRVLLKLDRMLDPPEPLYPNEQSERK